MTDSKDDKRVYLYDCTLRDGAQTQGVDFNVNDKIAVAKTLDELGIDYVEGGEGRERRGRRLGSPGRDSDRSRHVHGRQHPGREPRG